MLSGGWLCDDPLLVVLSGTGLVRKCSADQLPDADPSVGGGCLHEFALGASHTERKVISPRGRTLRFVEHGS